MEKINFDINESTIEEDFKRIANDLMNKWILVSGDEEYRITELEFYYKSENHPDGYSHSHVLQKNRDKWYFHGSGLDIAFGNNNAYGGILLRAIYNIKNKEYIYGPLKLLTELFKYFPDVYNLNIKFGLIYDINSKIEYQKPIIAPRVGLKEEIDQKYYDKPYRFLIMPEKKHAEKYKYEHK